MQNDTLLSLRESDLLKLECLVMHRQLFKSNAPNEIITRYIDAQKVIFTTEADRLPDYMLKIIKSNLDIEALEFYWRLRNFSPILQRKISILLFLVESQGQYSNYFYQFKSGRIRAFLELFFFMIRSIYLLTKGCFLSGWLKIV